MVEKNTFENIGQAWTATEKSVDIKQREILWGADKKHDWT